MSFSPDLFSNDPEAKKSLDRYLRMICSKLSEERARDLSDETLERILRPCVMAGICDLAIEARDRGLLSFNHVLNGFNDEWKESRNIQTNLF